MVDHTKQHANISLCFHRAEKNQKVRIILHLVEAMLTVVKSLIGNLSQWEKSETTWISCAFYLIALTGLRC